MTSYGTVVSYPIPAYANVPIESQYYQPNVFDISAITLGTTTTITISTNHNYVIGQEIRLLIPPSFGSRQLNGISGIVISIPAANQVTVNINSSQNVDAFIASSAPTTAQIIAVGDINNGQTNANGPLNVTTYIPGSFINISPI